MTGVLMRKGDIRTQRRACEDIGEGLYKPGREASEETISAHTMISDFWPPEFGEIRFLVVSATQSVGLCYDSSHKPTQT